jgi:carboxymethylenebutenolidase
MIAWTAISTGQPNGKKLPPFLEAFQKNKQPPIVSRMVSFPSALGPVQGFMARPDTQEQLPAVLLIHDEAGLTEWMKQNSRELSGIGYVVLAVDLTREIPTGEAERKVFREDERALVKLSGALRWLRRQRDVLPERIGVVGWSWGAGQALALTASARVQACVLCYGPISDDPGILEGLRGTPVLYIAAGENAKHHKAWAPLRDAVDKQRIPGKFMVFGGSVGFMGPPGIKAYVEADAEDAWVEVYEFLGKYVEDADLNPPRRPAEPSKSVATIADIMRAANSPIGLRGQLIRSLATEPADVRAWKQVRSEAALLAEAVGLLDRLKPPKGTLGHWQEQVHAFEKTAQSIMLAADQQDLAGARQALEKLGSRCAICHEKHR